MRRKRFSFGGNDAVRGFQAAKDDPTQGEGDWPKDAEPDQKEREWIKAELEPGHESFAGVPPLPVLDVTNDERPVSQAKLVLQ